MLNLSPNLKKFPTDVLEEAEIQIKYEGYINKQRKEAENNIRLEKMVLSKDIDYNTIGNLAIEARQKTKQDKANKYSSSI